MTKQVQRRRGTATQHTSFTGAEGELSVNTTNKSVHVHDNVTAGGFEAARADMDNVTSSSILTAAGITATTAELNYVDGVTSNIQTQLDGKAGTASPTFTGTLTTANLTATGTTTLAGASTSADITFGDNDKAIFGAGSDLQIYHDGSHSYVLDNGTGNLNLRGTGLRLSDASGTHYLVANSGAEVSLTYSGVNKLATTSTGIDVTGTVTADSLTVGNATSQNSLFDSVFGSGDANEGIVIVPSSTGKGWVGFNNGNNANIPAQFTYNFSSSLMELYSSGSLNIQTGAASRLNIASNGDISFYEDTGTTPKFFWDASAESLGIGTSSPNGKLHVQSSSGNTYPTPATQADDIVIENKSTSDHAGITIFSDNALSGNIYFGDENDADNGRIIYHHSDQSMRLATNGAERLRIDSSGNVGIGVSSIQASAAGKTLETSGCLISGGTLNSHQTNRAVIEYNVGANSMNIRAYGATAGSGIMTFATGGGGGSTDSEAMRIDSSGRLLVGKTASGVTNDGFEVHSNDYIASTRNSGTTAYFNRRTNDGDIIEFRKDNSTVGSISTINGDMFLGTSNTSVRFQDGSNAIIPVTSAGADRDNAIDIGTSAQRFKDLYLSGNAYADNFIGTNDTNTFIAMTGGDVIRHFTGGSERMRLDASGNLLVGKTSADNGATVGVELRGDISKLYVTDSASSPLIANRLASDGNIAVFQKDGTTVGSIGSRAGLVSTFILDPRSGGAGISAGGPVLYPTNESGSLTNGNMDFGAASYRWKDLYLSGGVIFGATGGSVTSKTLDDYEEGTWTPSIEASSSNPTVGYDAQRGTYTKVGRLVTVHFYIDTSSRTGGSGNLHIGGIPFAISSDNQALGASQGEYKGITMPSNANNIFIRVNPTATYFNLEFMDTRAGVSAALRGNVPIGNVGADSRILATVTYITDS